MTKKLHPIVWGLLVGACALTAHIVFLLPLAGSLSRPVEVKVQQHFTCSVSAPKTAAVPLKLSYPLSKAPYDPFTIRLEAASGTPQDTCFELDRLSFSLHMAEAQIDPSGSRSLYQGSTQWSVKPPEKASSWTGFVTYDPPARGPTDKASYPVTPATLEVEIIPLSTPWVSIKLHPELAGAIIGAVIGAIGTIGAAYITARMEKKS